jgi:hypothetical protein
MLARARRNSSCHPCPSAGQLDADPAGAGGLPADSRSGCTGFEGGEPLLNFQARSLSPTQARAIRLGYAVLLRLHVKLPINVMITNTYGYKPNQILSLNFIGFQPKLLTFRGRHVQPLFVVFDVPT